MSSPSINLLRSDRPTHLRSHIAARRNSVLLTPTNRERVLLLSRLDTQDRVPGARAPRMPSDPYFDALASFSLSAASRFEGSSKSAFLKQSVASSLRSHRRKICPHSRYIAS